MKTAKKSNDPCTHEGENICTHCNKYWNNKPNENQFASIETPQKILANHMGLDEYHNGYITVSSQSMIDAMEEYKNKSTPSSSREYTGIFDILKSGNFSDEISSSVADYLSQYNTVDGWKKLINWLELIKQDYTEVLILQVISYAKELQSNIPLPKESARGFTVEEMEGAIDYAAHCYTHVEEDKWDGYNDEIIRTAGIVSEYIASLPLQSKVEGEDWVKVEELESVMMQLGQAHDMLAKTKLTPNEYQPISSILATVKVELFKLHKKTYTK